MGISLLFIWPSNPENNEDQQKAHFEERIATFGGVYNGGWNYSISLYNHSVLRDIHGRGLPPGVADERDKWISSILVFTSLEGGNCYVVPRLLQYNEILETDTNFNLILKKIEIYELRQSMSIQGESYILNDFILRIGHYTQPDQSKQFILECEFTPYSWFTDKSSEQIIEFISQIVGKMDLNGQLRQHYTAISKLMPKYGLNKIYGGKHTALQLAYLLLPGLLDESQPVVEDNEPMPSP